MLQIVTNVEITREQCLARILAHSRSSVKMNLTLELTFLGESSQALTLPLS